MKWFKETDRIVEAKKWIMDIEIGDEYLFQWTAEKWIPVVVIDITYREKEEDLPLTIEVKLSPKDADLYGIKTYLIEVSEDEEPGPINEISLKEK